MNTFEAGALVVRGIALAIPSCLALFAIARPQKATLASGIALGLTLAFTGGALFTSGPPGSGATLGVRVDAVTCVMLLLVSTLGAVIVRYSKTYLHGNPGLDRYFRFLLLTLSAVTTLVLSNHLLVVALGWTATSLALHPLLTFQRGRPAALIAAHKKFLVGRLAEICLVACLALVHRDVGSLDLDAIASWADAHPALTPGMQSAAVLVVVAVALKSAQLPFHGWLVQVMEAPTPVSALLHAGVVNIGGLVLIRLAPWMVHADLARLLLVVIGLVSTVVAALVMTTRVSVKVALAWSTCAQMGFMLVQCGLGLWHLALLHLVAHSLYKAHAFLSAGGAVDLWRVQSLTRRPLPPAAGLLGLGVLAALGGAAMWVAAARRLGAPSAGDDLSVLVLAFVVALSMIPLYARQMKSAWTVAASAAQVGGVVLLYLGLHAVAAHLVPARGGTASAPAWILVGLGLAALFVVKTTLRMRPGEPLARSLYPWLFAGLYLDERFTRLVFRIWPPRIRPRPSTSPAIQISEPQEART